MLPTKLSIVVALAALIPTLLTGCGRTVEGRATDPASGEDPSAGGSDMAADEPAQNASGGSMASGDSPLTGAVSEDEFKRLHELTDAEAPPAQGEMIEVGGARAYLSLPEGDAPFPAVLVVHEWWGLNEHIKHWSDRLAADGYAALAVDLYGGEVATTPDRAMELMKAVDEEEAKAIIEAGAAFLATDDRVSATKRASIGWCFGGGWSLKAGIHTNLDATVMYYGHPVMDTAQLQELDGPLLGIFGNEDQSITPKKVDEFDAALDEAGVTHRILRYDANHAFANPSSGRYDHEAATQAWSEVRAFLEAQLVGAAGAE